MVEHNLWVILSSSISLAIGCYSVLLFQLASYVIGLRHGPNIMITDSTDRYLKINMVPRELQCVCGVIGATRVRITLQ